MTIYCLTNKCGFKRLVEASNEAKAYRHVARTEFTCSIPTVAEAIELGRNGTPVERAGEPDTMPALQADTADMEKLNKHVGETLSIAGELS